MLLTRKQRTAMKGSGKQCVCGAIVSSLVDRLLEDYEELEELLLRLQPIQSSKAALLEKIKRLEEEIRRLKEEKR